MTPFLLLVLNILLLVSGQFLWKYAVLGITTWNLNTIVQVVLSPYFILGGILYVVATGVWLVILSKLPLSIAYPVQSLSYVLAIIGASIFFKESISINQLIGLLLILFGVYWIAK